MRTERQLDRTEQFFFSVNTLFILFYLFGSLRWDGAPDYFIGLRGARPKKFGNHCTRASLNSDTVEDLIRISVEGPSLENFDARESVASWFSQGHRSRKPNYRSWLSKGHVTAMEDSS